MLQKIVNWLNKKDEEKYSPESEKQSNEKKSDNKEQKKILPELNQGDAIGLKKQIISFICNELQGYKFDKSLQISAITLAIQGCGYDDAIMAIVTSPDFEKELQRTLANKGIYAAANNICKWSFGREQPQNEKTKEIAKGIFLLIYGKEEYQETIQPPAPLKARIAALRGSLEQSNYILDARQRQKWNIGRGKEPVRDDRKHYNDIVIKDNNDEINRKVSGKHACIVFKQNEGFKLKTYMREDEHGRKKLTSTQIQREDMQSSRIFVDERQEFLLQNDDQIVLADGVILRFEYLTAGI